MSNDLLKIGVTGLIAFQRGLATTGHNIDNVNTEGYSRQRVDFEARVGANASSRFAGAGVKAVDVERVVSGFATTQLNNATSSNSRLETYLREAERVDALLSDQNLSLSNNIQRFYDALAAVNSAPESIPTREVFLQEAQQFLKDLNNMDNLLVEQLENTNQQLSENARDVAALSAEIANLNSKIINEDSSSNDMLDQRDELVRKISSYVSTQTTKVANSQLDVSIGTGEQIVFSGSSFAMTTITDTDDTTLSNIALTIGTGTRDITNSISGGSLGGLIEVRDQVLLPAIRSIGKIALGLANDINTQHQKGMDLNNNLGATFFSDVNGASIAASRVIANSANGGSAASLSASITSSNAIKSDPYELSFSSTTGFVVVNKNTSVVVGSGTISSLPQTISTSEGFSITVPAGSTFIAGDRFKIEPSRFAADGLSLNITSSTNIAVASPVRTNAVSTNTGTGTVSAAVISSASTSNFTTTSQALTPPINIVFDNPPTTYDIINATSGAAIESNIAFTAEQSNAIFPTPASYDPGIRINIGGTPAAGDTFNIVYNTGGFADNSNGLLMMDLQKAKNLSTSTETYQESYANLVGSVGSKSRQAEIAKEGSQALFERASSTRDSISAVNLDEEASNLMKYQQAYQAAAQIINVSKNVFDTIISAVR